jgi:multiple sugar transport system permease protein
MPILARVGRRSWKVRVTLALIYSTLALGALTMLYPLMLMVSGSVRSDTDFAWVTPVPEYLYDDNVLWMKYVESKYGLLPNAEAAQHRMIGSWRNIHPPAITLDQDERMRLFDEFRRTVEWPAEWYTLGHAMCEKPVRRLIPGQNTRRFRAAAQATYGTIEAYSDAAGVRYPAWSYVGPPLVFFAERRFTFPQTGAYRLYDEVKAQVPPADRIVVNLDGQFWRTYLAPQWATIFEYNRAHGTNFSDYREVLLDATPPPAGPRRRDWEDYVRNELNVAG